MRTLYLALTILGAVVPYVFFVQHFQTGGFGIGEFIAGAFANGAAGGFTADLLIASFTFWVYLFNRRTAHLWLYVAVNLTIGLSCALPLYLYLTTNQAAAVASRS
ncbi:MAG: DUF2834 domain-containing protein [Gammaproteobacteria bacterium]|nr:DUF2834 domain-containing protein [Gammaproteobacteria bacterium]